MSEELIQRDLINAPEKMGVWNYYDIGATSLKALKSAKIIPNRDYSEYEKKKPDVLVTHGKQVIATVEYKEPKRFRTEKQIQKAIQQELGTAQILESKMYVVTDGGKTFWINPNTGNYILDENGLRVDIEFNRRSSDTIKIMSRIIASINSGNDRILPTTVVDPLPLAEKVWQDLWSVSGATPENCLYTFVEIFIFKYLSDLGVLKGMHSFENLLAQYGTNSENEVLEIYASVIRPKIKELFPRGDRDNTTIINGTIFVSKDEKAVSGYGTVFKKILGRFEQFGSLENIDYDFKSKLFETFLKESISKKNWGQYFTPLKVVKSIVKMADVAPGMKVCDPACGVGKFLLEPILSDMNKFFSVKNGKLNRNICLVGYDKGFDKEEQKTIILAKANMLIYMSNLIKDNHDLTRQFAELFNDTFYLQTNSILGTLANPIIDEFDLILTNPPYVMNGSSNLKEEISKTEELRNYYRINAMGIEGLFMEWILRALKPGGKAFIVVPDGIMNRANDKKLRQFILDECILDCIISLPLNTFFTTNKKTYIMGLTKKAKIMDGGVEKRESQVTPVFTYLCSEIGETRDVNRFDIEQNDLEEASNLFAMFKGAKNVFKTKDRRCKLFDVKAFEDAQHWSVDRWWSREEKIEIGIEDEEDSVDLNGYIGLINEVVNCLNEYYEPLRELAKKKEEIGRECEVFLADKAFFDLEIGPRKLKKDYLESKGTIPVYSANVFEPFVYAEESNISDFDYPYVIWGIDGTFEFNAMDKGTVFATTDHCGSIKIKNDQINPLYLAYILEQNKHLYGFDRGLRASLTNMKQVSIKIPVDENGKFDYKVQEDIADVLRCMNQMKAILIEKGRNLKNVHVNFSNQEYDLKYFALHLLLEPVKGKSKYTKKYGQQHKGEFPVYSASNTSELTRIDTYDFNGKYLSWSTNGFAGVISIFDGKFSINGDRGILLPQAGRTDLEYRYLKYVLEPIFRELAKGRKGDNGEDEFTKLYPSMIGDIMIPLPVDSNGNISVKMQREIADKYEMIYRTTNDVVEKITRIVDQNVII